MDAATKAAIAAVDKAISALPAESAVRFSVMPPEMTNQADDDPPNHGTKVCAMRLVLHLVALGPGLVESWSRLGQGLVALGQGLVQAWSSLGCTRLRLVQARTRLGCAWSRLEQGLVETHGKERVSLGVWPMGCLHVAHAPLTHAWACHLQALLCGRAKHNPLQHTA